MHFNVVSIKSERSKCKQKTQKSTIYLIFTRIKVNVNSNLLYFVLTIFQGKHTGASVNSLLHDEKLKRKPDRFRRNRRHNLQSNLQNTTITQPKDRRCERAVNVGAVSCYVYIYFHLKSILTLSLEC